MISLLNDALAVRVQLPFELPRDLFHLLFTQVFCQHFNFLHNVDSLVEVEDVFQRAEHFIEVGAVQGEALHGPCCYHVRLPRCVLHQGKLSEVISGRTLGEDLLNSSFDLLRNGDVSRLYHEEVLSRIALLDNILAVLELHCFHRLGDLHDDHVAQLREEGDLSEERFLCLPQPVLHLVQNVTESGSVNVPKLTGCDGPDRRSSGSAVDQCQLSEGCALCLLKG
mmetsp:Transcript_1423/g.2488  ORF Transcript_1423/g.2488 Transcript_1423/m.2488 type:complete len:224 (-) Transcript_1423:1287-1958(-)